MKLFERSRSKHGAIHLIASAVAALQVLSPEGTGGLLADIAASVVGVTFVMNPSYTSLGALAILALPTLGFAGPSGHAPWMNRAPDALWLLPVYSIAVIVGLRRAKEEGRDRAAILLLASIAFVAVVASTRGYLAGNNAWSAPLRATAVMGGWAWGRAAAGSRTARGSMSGALVLSGLLLLIPHWFLGHLRFQAIGITGAALVTALGVVSIRMRVLGALGLMLSVRTGTEIGIFAVANGMAWWNRIFRARRAPIAVMILVSAAVLLAGLTFSGRYSSETIEGGYRLPSGESVEAKLFADRGPLWSAAARAIEDHGLAIPPSGAGFPLPGLPVAWTGGAHNVWLQAGVDMGILALLLVGGLYLYVLHQTVRYDLSEARPSVAVLLWGSLAPLLVGSALGQFPIQESGWFIWAAIGYAIPKSQSDARRHRQLLRAKGIGSE